MRRIDPATAALVAANMVPLAGILLLGWDTGFVIVLYWAENVIIGGYNLLKMAIRPVERPAEHIVKAFPMFFFALHYGGFCAVHGIFVLVLTKQMGNDATIFPEEAWFAHLVFLQILGGVVAQLFRTAGSAIVWPILALVASHGISFVQNHILGGERRKLTFEKLMGAPYGRVILLHVGIIAGAAPVMLLGSPLPLLLLLVIGKTILDLKMHRRSHAKGTEDPTGG